ncbi:short-chain dehydrogenase, partial [Burkholderia ambifaria]|nr:short-chain dehydrogenase [Burkholderia ambifaria]
TGAEAGLGTSRALAFAAVFAVLAAGFVAARKLDR